jgi:hypothetical protein
MPWYALCYVAAIAALGIDAFLDETREGVGTWYRATDALVTLGWILFVVAYYAPPLVGPARRLLPLAFAFAVAWTAFDARRALRNVIAARPESYEPGLSPRANLWIDRGVEAFAVLVGVLVALPAVVMGLRVVLRAR